MDTMSNNLRRFYTILILVLMVGITLALFSKTYARSGRDDAQLAGDATAKMDCITQKHDGHQAMLDDPEYRRQLAVYQIPDVELRDQYGERVSFQSLLDSDEPILMNFIYTSCTTICPVLTSGFSKTQEILGGELKNARMVSISIDPEHDTPEVLAKYSKRFHADEGWIFLTGNLDDVVELQSAFNAYRGDKMSHVPLTYLRGRDRDTWLQLEGFPSAEEIVQEYQTLVAQTTRL